MVLASDRHLSLSFSVPVHGDAVLRLLTIIKLSFFFSLWISRDSESSVFYRQTQEGPEAGVAAPLRLCPLKEQGWAGPGTLPSLRFVPESPE